MHTPENLPKTSELLHSLNRWVVWHVNYTLMKLLKEKKFKSHGGTISTNWVYMGKFWCTHPPPISHPSDRPPHFLEKDWRGSWSVLHMLTLSENTSWEIYLHKVAREEFFRWRGILTHCGLQTSFQGAWTQHYTNVDLTCASGSPHARPPPSNKSSCSKLFKNFAFKKLQKETLYLTIHVMR